MDWFDHLTLGSLAIGVAFLLHRLDKLEQEIALLRQEMGSR